MRKSCKRLLRNGKHSRKGRRRHCKKKRVKTRRQINPRNKTKRNKQVGGSILIPRNLQKRLNWKLQDRLNVVVAIGRKIAFDYRFNTYKMLYRITTWIGVPKANRILHQWGKITKQDVITDEKYLKGNPPIRFETVTGHGYKSKQNYPIILYLHGGAYCFCSPASHRELTAKIANRCAAKLYSFKYRLAPMNPYPAALEDAISAYEWLIDEEKIEPGQLFIMGDSAGGGLAVALLYYLTAKNQNIPLPNLFPNNIKGGASFLNRVVEGVQLKKTEGVSVAAGAVLLSPWVDLTDCWDTKRHTKNGTSSWDTNRNSKDINNKDFLPIELAQRCAKWTIEGPGKGEENETFNSQDDMTNVENEIRDQHAVESASQGAVEGASLGAVESASQGAVEGEGASVIESASAVEGEGASVVESASVGAVESASLGAVEGEGEDESQGKNKNKRTVMPRAGIIDYLKRSFGMGVSNYLKQSLEKNEQYLSQNGQVSNLEHYLSSDRFKPTDTEYKIYYSPISIFDDNNSHYNKILENLPPILIHHGTNEVLYDQQRVFEEKLNGINTDLVEREEFEDMVHVFQLFSAVYGGHITVSFNNIREFVHKKLN